MAHNGKFPDGKLCRCMCHDLQGGPIHRFQKCLCNGGVGYDDDSEWERVTTDDWRQTGAGDARTRRPGNA